MTTGEMQSLRPLFTRRRIVGVLAGGSLMAAAAGFAVFHRPAYTGHSLSVHDAHGKAQNGDILLVDIRRPDEWEKTGIPEGAVPIDMRRDDFVTALRAVQAGDISRPVALICARGVRSARLSNRLTEAGFTNIIDVPEGMLGSTAGRGWLSKKLPTIQYEETSG